MSELLVLLAAAGITFGLQHKIKFLHKKIDILDHMLMCTYCTGFHGGWIAYLLFSIPDPDPQHALMFAFSSAIFSYALDEGIKYLEDSNNGDDSE